MDTKTYLDTYYETAVFTKTAPEAMAQLAAQQDIDTQTIKGATDFKGLEGDIKALVYVSEKSDFSTFVHEAAHVARRTMQGELLQQAEKAFGVTDGKWTRETGKAKYERKIRKRRKLRAKQNCRNSGR
ncbi:hypothetical protein V1L52_04115 [Treponema sp. HNW]|uniref:hypothetical protein n=1 Tax=Treponema sp. HNW TaxID=3116654 RepID=UPI003D0A2560